MAPSSTSSSGTRRPSQDIFSAAMNGDLNFIKRSNGGEFAKAFLEAKDNKGRAPLHYAAVGGRTNVCKYLVETVKVNVNVRDFNGDTPLNVAVLLGKYPTAAYLLDHGANPNVFGIEGMTPLHRAAQKGRNDELRLLLSKGAEVNVQCLKGTPLQLAAEYGQKDAVKILLEHQANPNLGNRHTFHNPLIRAIIAGSLDCVRLLLKHGADPNQLSHRMPPLFIAASWGNPEIVKCLLKAGANANTTNFYDRTPIDIAAHHGNHSVVKALFPSTNPIPHFPVWSIEGIFEYINSEEATTQRKLKMEEKFLEAKAKGAEAVKNNEFFDAISWYSEALSVNPEDAIVLSNTSFCWARLKEGDYALEYAKSCIKLRGDWPKAYYRAGAAWMILKDYKEAAEAFGQGLKLDPESKELLDAYNDAMAKLQAPKSCTDVLSNLFGGGAHFHDDDDHDDNDDSDGLMITKIHIC